MANKASPLTLALEEFCSKINERKLQVGIVGLGYVGLPLLMRFCEVGFNVIGVDASQQRIDQIRRGESPISHISNAAISNTLTTGRCGLTSNFADLQVADAILICVPTPLTPNRTPDMDFVRDVAQSIRPFLRLGQIVCLESTVYPGATEEIFLPILQDAGFTVGMDIFLAYSPEREDPGNVSFSTRNTPKVCGGATDQCTDRAVSLYSQITQQVVQVSTIRTAEMTKLLENIHRCVNIGLVNEMKVVADQMDINIHEVITAAATKPFGFTPYWPGPGLGGHCIPIDPFYMTWKAREFGIDTRFIELAGQVNSAMPDFVVGKIIKALNDQGVALSAAKILVCGLAYKKNIDDFRESPAIAIINRLQKWGAKVDIDDRYVGNKDIYEILEPFMIVDSSRLDLKSYNCVVIATDHDYFDYTRIKEDAVAVVDSRGRYQRHFPGLYAA